LNFELDTNKFKKNIDLIIDSKKGEGVSFKQQESENENLNKFIIKGKKVGK